tara:strand:- start:24877 stop:25995 length:1119 start_codon:yes stop_codon:yes gene_type:complete
MTYDLEKSGIGSLELAERVPKFSARDGDGIITAAIPGLDGVDNNACIILGRDRTGAASGGFGKYKRAGAIDIVVGRQAPKCAWTLEPESKNFLGIDSRDFRTAGPLFNAIIDPKLKDYKIDDDGSPPLKEDVESVAMDAARIYLSQKCRIDDAFRLTPTNNGPRMASTNPRSAIAMKADHVRLISREGMKLVTMGSGVQFPENVSSQGHKLVKTYGIDLIAGNGIDANGKAINQEPLVKGHAMMKMISEMITLVDNLTGIVSTFFAQQNIINNGYLAEFGASGAGLVVMDPVSRTVATTVTIDMLAKTVTSLTSMKSNLAKFKWEHGLAVTKDQQEAIGALSSYIDGSDEGESRFKSVIAGKSPLSRYNTTN